MAVDQIDSAKAAIERVKAVCVVGMVAVHGFYWAATDHGRVLSSPDGPLAQFVANNMYFGLLPLLLPFTAGCSLRQRWADTAGRLRAPGVGATVTTAVILLVIALLLNLLAFGFAYALAWNVLQFVALATVVIALLQRVGSLAVLLAGVAVLLSADPLRTAIPFWQGPGWQRVLLGDPADFHSWPFFPWFATVAAGWCGAHLLLQTGGDRRARLALLAAGLGLTLLTASTGTLLPRFRADNLIGPLVMNPPALYAVGVIGLGWLVTAVLSFLPAGLLRRGWVRNFAGGILPIYVGHMIIGARGMTLVDGWLDREALLASLSLPALLWLAAVPLFLVFVSRFIGHYAVTWLHHRRIHIRVRPVASSSRSVS